MTISSEIEILKSYAILQSESNKKSFLLDYIKGINNIDDTIIPFVLGSMDQDIVKVWGKECKIVLLKIYINIYLNQSEDLVNNLHEYNRFSEYKYFETNIKLAIILYEDGKLDESFYYFKKSIESHDICFNWTKTRNLCKNLHSHTKNNYKNINLVFLSKYTNVYYNDCLNINCLVNDLHPNIYTPEYGVLEQEIIDTNSELYKFDPDFVLFALNWRDIFFPENINDRQNCIEETFHHYEDLFLLLLKNTKANIIFQLFDYPQYNSEGMLGYREERGKNRIIDSINEKFLGINNLRINYINPNIINNSQTIRWFDPQLWYSFKHYPSFEATFHLCKNYLKQINAVLGKSKKIIILDLDNTIWGGVIGEDGISGIALGSISNLGLIFYDIQCYLKELHSRGILLAICSKNNPEQVLEVFQKHPECPLKTDDFSSIKVNWQSKSENIIEIKSELNIGYDSMVFIDDSPFERAEVRSKIPGVSIISLPNDPFEYIETIHNTGYFEVNDITKEDLARNRQYKDNSKRETAKTRYKDIDNYLYDLKMNVIINNFNDINLKRIHQLINKTNQFNLTTKRHTLKEIQEFTNSSNYKTLSFNLSDTFGDYGLVGIALIENNNNSKWIIKNLLMSCRAIGRKFENFMMDTIVNLAQSNHIETIYGEYIKTKYNGLVFEYFNSVGFTERESVNNIKKYELKVAEYKHTAGQLFNRK